MAFWSLSCTGSSGGKALRSSSAHDPVLDTNEVSVLDSIPLRQNQRLLAILLLPLDVPETAVHSLTSPALHTQSLAKLISMLSDFTNTFCTSSLKDQDFYFDSAQLLNNPQSASKL